AGRERAARRLDRIGLGAAARVAQHGDLVDVDAELDHGTPAETASLGTTRTAAQAWRGHRHGRTDSRQTSGSQSAPAFHSLRRSSLRRTATWSSASGFTSTTRVL